MKPLALSGLLIPLRLWAARLLRDKRGNAAIEFAVILPVMLTLFFGMIEFSSAVAVDRKVSMAAQALADLASRYKSVKDTDITNFFTIGNAMMTPYPATPLHATITELYIDPATGAARAQWSKGYAPVTAGTVIPVPPNLIARDSVTNVILADQYLIFTEANYRYLPTVGYVMAIAGVPLSEKSYMRPRLQACVFYSPATACTKS
jgi:Flp pilus assembly protein TadG